MTPIKFNFLTLFILISLLVYSLSLRKFMRFNNELFTLVEKDKSISGICNELNIDSEGNFMAKCFGKEIKENLNKCISVTNKGKLRFFQDGDFSKKCEKCRIEEYYEGEKLICKCLNSFDEKVYTELQLTNYLVVF